MLWLLVPWFCVSLLILANFRDEFAERPIMWLGIALAWPALALFSILDVLAIGAYSLVKRRG